MLPDFQKTLQQTSTEEKQVFVHLKSITSSRSAVICSKGEDVNKNKKSFLYLDSLRELPPVSAVIQSSLSRCFGHVKHAHAFVFLQQLVLGADLLPQRGQLLLLLRRAAVYPGHVGYLLPSFLDLRLQLGQLLVDILAVFVHA